jgi:DNA-binding Lrp family transcriptional regulator
MNAASASTRRLTDLDSRVLAAALSGLPLTETPYATLAAALGVEESAVLDAMSRLAAAGVLKRFGLVVRHHELGFRANAMCVFDVPEARVADSAARLKALPFVTLCYRRVRRPPQWPYNLFCMIHGTDRAEVEAQYAQARRTAGLDDVPSTILFSRRRFKQCAGRYVATSGGSEANSRAA